jgi:hypothetical protein
MTIGDWERTSKLAEQLKSGSWRARSADPAFVLMGYWDDNEL